MAPTHKEVADLINQHQAIKTHMKFLIKGLKKLTAQSHGEKGKPAQLKEQISLYRWSLYDFQDAVTRHMELDEHIFQALRSRSPEDSSEEHKVIRKRIDDVIQLAGHAVYKQMDLKELNRMANDIREAVKRICELALEHIAKEDCILKAALKNPEPS